MRIGNAAWGLRETPLEEQLKITSAMGLDLLELSIAGYGKDFLQLDADQAKISKVKELFRQYKVALECGCTGNDFTGDREKTEGMGAPIQLGSDTFKTWDDIAEYFSRLGGQ